MARHSRGTPAHRDPTHRERDPGRDGGRPNNRRCLSQNFLADPDTARWFVRLSGVSADDLVVEVGPGEGAITRFLAPTARRVIAHELDPRLAERLADRYRDPDKGVRVVHGDFTRSRPPREPFSVVGNIPYSRTSDIVRWCLEAPMLTSAVLVTQLEYARKRTGAYGRWSLVTVLSWPWWSWRLAGRIDRNRFRPAPRVDAGVLVLGRRTEPLVPVGRRAQYRRMVELGFSGVGGSLSASLSREFPAGRVGDALRSAGVDTGTPVGLVRPDQWLEVFRALRGPGRPGPRRDRRG
ncbi:ErmE/ErmH/ErmO/ErmR family 23S rRNA (adenine(2058)-N(6))-methyltransferase [Nocardiopsis sp. SBT366]|uniref:ErmE/ErmH/ErmO/ErmR family 23S rRNA (adenine(2058)-N(6))-methyltransferase n=1 Tax=Nocardiopsis sp. SBT366 TaxID=1580529 RepID=UPI00066CF0BF|nr:ErmE/ErmH/ErmO/ErmR family 23S rRNA (adenine(2058)-N(6))-methyltransferase [Nocardiopsis sp. SBT366]